MTRSLLASSDAGATIKILAYKICLITVSSALNGLERPEVVFMLVFAFFATYNHCCQVGGLDTTQPTPCKVGL